MRVRVGMMLFVDPSFVASWLPVRGTVLWFQIKWITDIEVTDLESDNHYHYFDNRVLPSQVRMNDVTVALIVHTNPS